MKWNEFLKRALVTTGYDKIVGTELQFVRVDRRQMGTFLCIASNEVSPGTEFNISKQTCSSPSQNC